MLVEKNIIVGAVFALLIAIVLGYPQFVIRPLLGEQAAPILSNEHQTPNFSMGNLGEFLYEYLYRTEFLLTFLVAAWVIWRWRSGMTDRADRTDRRDSADALDFVALAPVVLFLVVFGLADVTTGRFALVIVSPLLVLGARAWARLDKIRFVRYTAVFLFALQALGIIFLTRIVWGGDTRAQAAKYLLWRTTNETIAITMDPAFAGLAPTAATVDVAKPGPKGAIDALIKEKGLAGPKSRNLKYWDGAAQLPKDAQYVMSDLSKIDAAISFSGFELTAEFIGSRTDSSISWGFVRSRPWPSMPIVFDLPTYKAMGPNVRVYRRVDGADRTDMTNRTDNVL